MTRLTTTQQAFWLSVFEHAQVVTCASERKSGLRKLWWKMKAIEAPALGLEASKELVRDYIARHGMLIESPELYVGHVVKQAGGNPQAIFDAGTLVVASRYLAIGLGDTAMYVLAGFGAALFLAVRFFLFKGSSRTTAYFDFVRFRCLSLGLPSSRLGSRDPVAMEGDPATLSHRHCHPWRLDSRFHAGMTPGISM